MQFVSYSLLSLEKLCSICALRGITTPRPKETAPLISKFYLTTVQIYIWFNWLNDISFTLNGQHFNYIYMYRRLVDDCLTSKRKFCFIIRICHHFQRRAAKCRSLLCAYDLIAWRDLYPATPAVILDLSIWGLIKGPLLWLPCTTRKGT